MRKRTKKAAFAAAFGYISIVGLGLGMLKAAQQTRRTLYGGAPVMAQITHETETAETAITLGGGEWTIAVTPPETHTAIAAAEALPPSTAKLLLRLAILADRAANYTAELITGA